MLRPYMVLILAVVLVVSFPAEPAAAASSPQTPPPPSPTPAATPAPDPSPTVIQQIYQVIFSEENLAAALTGLFTAAAESEAENLAAQTAQWGSILAGIMQAPASGAYQQIAGTSLTSAAALAPALFLLRLAFFHWRGLTGDPDSLLRTVGDWVVAGFTAVSAGAFLDLLVRLSWWLAASALGETSQLAFDFIQAVSVIDLIKGIGQVSLFTPIIVLSTALAGMLAMIALLFAFVVSQAVLYVLAVIAAPLAVAAVLPPLRWLRDLWLKAAAVLALMPVVAGGIFKAGLLLGLVFSGGGNLLDLFIRLLWLWGAAGALLAMAGILSRVTLSAGGEALHQLAHSGRVLLSSSAKLAGLARGRAASTRAGSGSSASAPRPASAGARSSPTASRSTPLDGGISVQPDRGGALSAPHAAETNPPSSSTTFAGSSGPARYSPSPSGEADLAEERRRLQAQMEVFFDKGSGSTPASEEEVRKDKGGPSG